MLLKNEDAILPLALRPGRPIAVIGGSPVRPDIRGPAAHG